MIKQEVVDEIRIAMYEDVGLMYDFYTDRWKDDTLRDVQEYVPDITQEELDEYIKQDEPYVTALVKLALKVANDRELLDSLFDQTPEKAYETVKGITGDKIPYEDFVDILEYGGKPFFKTFEGAAGGDEELSEDELLAVVGGSDKDRAEAGVLKILEKIIISVARCFTAESLVDSPSGAKAIGNVTAGDIVYSLDKDGNKVETKVTDTTNGEASVIEVHFADGRIWNTTSTQWFYDGTTFRSIWQYKDRDIVTLDGKTQITDIVETGRKEMVYDIVLDGNNIMFINGAAAESYGS